ncbi:MAG: isopentenyl transferase family protein, partial [Pseudomonadota bacterium]|nr:isopentenyl transferase family protein [Pseudomonadota bacterium]
MTSNAQNPVLVVCGPTASGKSNLALDIAIAFGGTVINADSMQLYRELRILTARPSPTDEAQAPH